MKNKIKKMKARLLLIAILLSTAPLAFSQPNIGVNGFVRNYTGIQNNNGDFNMLQNTLNLDFNLISDKVALKANPMLYLYGIDSLDFVFREVYLKYSLSSSAIDFDLMGAYTWDQTLSMYIEKEFIFDSLGNPVLSGLLITPEHHRLYFAGGSFTSTIKSFVLRGEAADYNGKYFQTTDLMTEGTLTKKDYVHYVVGLDYGVGDLTLSVQFIHKVIFGYNDYIDEEHYGNTMTFLARYEAMRQTLHLELFSYIGLNYGDALIRPHNHL